MTHATQLTQLNAIASVPWLGLSSLSIAGAIALFAPIANAQSIQAANDGIGTQITTTGNQFDISGGSLAGQNLLQSFEKFGLNAGETANFLTDAKVQNVLGRVVGGEASLIDGRLQISGSNANLYLLNPAGIVFGGNASLNLPASFSATTANSIDFGNASFSALGDVNLSALTGAPASLSFAGGNGSIVNAAELAVAEGQALSLTGESVVNTGSLTAPGGEITVAAIADGQQVRISAKGSVLGLGVAVEDLQQNQSASLVELVAGASERVATGVVVAEDGSIRLGNSDLALPVQPGLAAVSGGLSATGETGGTIQVLGEQVALVDAQLDVSGQRQGGTVLVGGNFKGKGPLPNAQRTFVGPESQILANAEAGDGGQVIVWADGSTQFYGDIEARAGQTQGDGGFVEVSGKDHLVYQGTTDTTAPNGEAGTLLLDPTDILITSGQASERFSGQVLAEDPGPSILTQSQLEFLPGNTNVVIQATNNITIEPLNRGVLAFQPGNGEISFEAGGQFSMSPNDTIDTGARNLSITAGDIALGTVSSSTVSLNATPIFGGIGSLRRPGGDVSLVAEGGNITATTIATGGGQAGSVTALAANGSFTANAIDLTEIGFAFLPQADELVIQAAEGVSVGRIFSSSGVSIRVNDQDLSGSSSLFITGVGVGDAPPNLIAPAVSLLPLLSAQESLIAETNQAVRTGIQISDDNQPFVTGGSLDNKISQLLYLSKFGTSLESAAQIADLASSVSLSINRDIQSIAGISGSTGNLNNLLIQNYTTNAVRAARGLLNQTVENISTGGGVLSGRINRGPVYDTVFDFSPHSLEFLPNIVRDNF